MLQSQSVWFEEKKLGNSILKNHQKYILAKVWQKMKKSLVFAFNQFLTLISDLQNLISEIKSITDKKKMKKTTYPMMKTNSILKNH